MAFDINSFNNVTSGAAKGVKMWAYNTTADTVATVIADDYFLGVANALTAGDLLYIKASDGAGWYVVLAASSTAVDLGPTEGAAHVRVTIPSVDVLALRAAPKALVAAPGENKTLVFERAILQLDYATTQYTESDDNLAVKYTDGSGVAVSDTIECTNFITAAADTTTTAIPLKDAIVANSACENQGLVLHNTGDGEFATGDSPVIVDVFFRVVNGV